MSTGNPGLKRLYGALSAKERAKLVLQGLKDEVEEDWLWRASAPGYQSQEFNRLIRMINGVNGGGGTLLVLLSQRSANLSTSLALAAALRHAAITSEFGKQLLRESIPEAITESAFTARQSEWGRHQLSLDEIVDLELTFEGLEPNSVSRRNKADVRKVIRTAIQEGRLRARPAKTGPKVTRHAYYRWKGVPIPFPDSRAYVLLPDSQATEVEVRNGELALLMESLGRVQSMVRSPLMIGLINEVVYVVQAVEAVDTAIEAVAVELDGEDPCRTEVRMRLDHLKVEVEKLEADLFTITGCEKLPEDDELSRRIQEMILSGIHAEASEPAPEPSLLDKLLATLEAPSDA